MLFVLYMILIVYLHVTYFVPVF